MMSLSRILSGRQPKEVLDRRQREIDELKSKVSDAVQAVKSGNRVLETLSGTINLNKRRHPK